jgi:hypothetical protein
VDDYDKTGLALYQNIPNPARSLTRIDYMLPSSGEVRFGVVDLVGKELYSEAMNRMAGKHYVELEISGYSAGTYYYFIEFKGQRLTKKMVITK